MPIAMTAQQEADLIDPTIPKLVVWGLSLNTDEGVLAISNLNVAVTVDTVTYEAGADKFKIEGDLTTGQALDAETLVVNFDAVDQYVSGSFLERLLNNTYHLRPMLLRLMIFRADTRAFIVAPREYAGFMDQIEFAERSQGESTASLNCETGTFRSADKRHITCSDADQRRRNATDRFFVNTAAAGTLQVPFGVPDSALPGVAPNSGGSRGGGTGGGTRNLF